MPRGYARSILLCLRSSVGQPHIVLRLRQSNTSRQALGSIYKGNEEPRLTNTEVDMYIHTLHTGTY